MSIQVPTPKPSRHCRGPRPKIMFFGDPHGDFRFVIRSVQRYQPEASILLGDIQARRPLQLELEPILDSTALWFIHGNHDTDSEADYDNLFLSELAHRNLHGRVVEVAGLRVAGLGGVFRGAVWEPPLAPVYGSVRERLKGVCPSERWRGGISLRHRSTIWPDEYQRLMRQRADVLVLHEAPGGSHHGWAALDELAAAMHVRDARAGPRARSPAPADRLRRRRPTAARRLLPSPRRRS